MNSKDNTVADFQACTGIEDVGLAFKYLEDHQWNLIDAVNSAMKNDNIVDINYKGDDISIISPSQATTSLNNIYSANSSSSHKVNPLINTSSLTKNTNNMGPKILIFNITYKDKTSVIKVLESQTVGKLKEYIEERFKIPTKEIYLSGWYNNLKVFNYTILSSLSLPIENNLQLSKLSHMTSGKIPSSNESQSKRLYTLYIKNCWKDQKYTLQMPGDKTIKELKDTFAEMSSIPTKDQEWIGFPFEIISDSVTLNKTGINFPTQDFEVFNKASDSNLLSHTSNGRSSVDEDEPMMIAHLPPPTSSKIFSNIHETQEEGEGDEEFLDSSDNFGVFDAPCSSFKLSNQQPLILPNTIDVVEGQIHFVNQFELRYGKTHPQFFIGTMQHALDASCNLPILERKLLVVYLHHEKSILSNIFISLNLCSETVINYLNANFILWPWDVTHTSNKELFLRITTIKFGKILENTLKTTNVNEYPCLIVFQKCRGQFDILNIFKGSTCLEDLMTTLIHSVDMFRNNQQSSLQEEMERDTRENIKREQDEAYRLSLETDKAKKIARVKEIEQEQLIQKLKEEEDEFKMKEKEAIKMSLADSLPEEPPKDCVSPVTTIKIRCINQSKTFQRRFLASTKLEILLNYIASLGFDQKEYSYMTYWPTFDISQLNPNETLKTHNLYPQVSLTITERVE